jgi:hypothetical protein
MKKYFDLFKSNEKQSGILIFPERAHNVLSLKVMIIAAGLIILNLFAFPDLSVRMHRMIPRRYKRNSWPEMIRLLLRAG